MTLRLGKLPRSLDQNYLPDHTPRAARNSETVAKWVLPPVSFFLASAVTAAASLSTEKTRQLPVSLLKEQRLLPPSLPFLEGGGWFEALLSRFELQIGFFSQAYYLCVRIFTGR